ncbi:MULTISPECIES: type I secretion system permease/ATPase [unclassified Campylobacter]|uniref:peptidase domain-containing ABC transporter n=1 Tax=unclassified Campylobacter TaxID=2593542 RepID=UPI001BDB51F4|nr:MULTISPECIES: type I secretion system permease/ATPase [unclassified Campylobacter]MBZ7978274.1 type I secretion system permease/ATPase [Campylobacter sp. RM12654]MBZ7980103.1 type I secretion system permease/ATPase [Campylobacter sp. RM12642]MBZ7984522.1 type I secretion system permease/ATPase [Campylobacter sp. RM12647]MBT0881328.1 type I secretion system permease/ATPase [Campylobacter sp. 2018MI27]MBT0884886.1 type I secretion system permease/ATPase [Campylobacter sp. 2018MI10]
MHTALGCLSLCAQFANISIDINAICNKYALKDSEPSIYELAKIAKDNDFKVKIKKLNLKNLHLYKAPFIFLKKDLTYFVVLKLDFNNQQALIFDGGKEARQISYEELHNLSSDKILILAHKLLNDSVKFGFSWFYKRMLSYKGIVLQILLASFVMQLFGLVTPLFTQVVLDKVLLHHSISTLNVIAFAFFSVIVFESLLSLSRNYIFTHTTTKIDAKLGSELFTHLLLLPMVYFENRKVGNIAARIRELDNIRDFIANKSVSVILDLLFSIVFILMMLLYSVKLTFVSLAFVICIALIYFFITPILRARLEDKFQMGAASNSYLVESITGMQTIKSLAIEGSMKKYWEDYLAKYLKSSFNLSNLSNIASTFANSLQKLMTLAILYFGVGLVIDGSLSVGQLIAFQMFANQFSAPIMRLVSLWNELQQAILSVDRLGDILNTPQEQTTNKPISLNQVSGNIKFDNVSFKYSPNSNYVLNNLSFNLQANKSIGIVGRSGSGKSTITKLIERLYIPNEGSIYIDGIDLRHLNPYVLRSNLGVVLQENYLFSGSIKENISLSKPSASMQEIINVCKIAGAHDFISELSAGYDTLVGERGSALSGGQRQRIAIARALLHNPRVLIFDEATSALDYESEKIITSNLSLIKQNKTFIIIAHRLSTVKDCDEILVLDKGNLVECGNHTKLMELNGYYAHLYKQQNL